MLKRLVVGVFVSSVVVLGIAPGASAASSHQTHQAVAKVKKAKALKTVKTVKIGKLIDWDAPSRVSGGGFTTQRIDWD